MNAMERLNQFIDFKGISKYSFYKKQVFLMDFLDKNRKYR